MMRMMVAVGLALALAGCKAEMAQMQQALRGQPPVLAGTLAGRWQVADVNGGGVPAGSPMLAFADSGDISGSTGCNRVSGHWQQHGASISIGPLAGTRKACPGPAMAAEAQLLAVLQAATSLRFAANGTAQLMAPDGRRLSLRRDTP
jgi:putative lipoprotein